MKKLLAMTALAFVLSSPAAFADDHGGKDGKHGKVKKGQKKGQKTPDPSTGLYSRTIGGKEICFMFNSATGCTAGGACGSRTRQLASTQGKIFLIRWADDQRLRMRQKASSSRGPRCSRKIRHEWDDQVASVDVRLDC